jgi:hypothetical protein
MSYRERQRLADIQAAIDAIRSHLQRGDLTDGLIFDAVRIRLLEIGEAVKALPDDLLATQPSYRGGRSRAYWCTTPAINTGSLLQDASPCQPRLPADSALIAAFCVAGGVQVPGGRGLVVTDSPAGPRRRAVRPGPGGKRWG